MKTRTRICISIVALIVLGAWTKTKTTNIEKAEWLIGTWENKTQRGSIFETWNKVSENEFKGKSYAIKEQDTMFFENIQLLQENHVVFYIPIVKNQNHGLPVRFTAEKISETELVFKNAAHDFPQIISYTKIGSYALVAEISGMRNGQEHKQTFSMKRVR